MDHAISTERLLLRPLRLADAEAICSHLLQWLHSRDDVVTL